MLRRCPSEHVKTTPHTEPSYEDRCPVWFTAAIDLQRAAGSGSTLGPPCPSLGPLGRSGTAALPSPRVVQKMGVPLVWGNPLTYMWMMLLDSHGMFGWKWHEMVIFDIVDCVKS